jgi:hypothetical protein
MLVADQRQGCAYAFYLDTRRYAWPCPFRPRRRQRCMYWGQADGLPRVECGVILWHRLYPRSRIRR